MSRTLELDEESQKQLAESLLRFSKYMVHFSRPLTETESRPLQCNMFTLAHLSPDKFYAVTQTTLDNIRAANLTAEYPLSLAEEELEIVKETRASTLIQGRSGTGKTTCLVYKLFGRYLASKIPGATSSPRQVGFL